MESVPVCLWDASFGWIFIHLSEEQATDSHWVVVRPRVKGAKPYLATVLVSGQRRTVIKAPKNGVFDVFFHTFSDGLEALRKDDRRAARVAFSDELRYDNSQPVGADHQVEFSVFALTQSEKGVFARIGKTRTLAPGEKPREVLQELAAQIEGQEGVSEANIAATVIEHGVRGPCDDADLDHKQVMGVLFGEARDESIDQSVFMVLPGFEELRKPAVRVDLTRFGNMVEHLLPAFAFIHVPYNTGQAGMRIVTGKEVGLGLLKPAANGGYNLVYNWEDGCHRDSFGVYFSGGSFLEPRDKSGGLERALNFGQVASVVTTYFGNRFDLDTQTEEAILESLQEKVPTVPISDIQLKSARSWVTRDTVVARFQPDLTAAVLATPAFIFSYAALLQRVVGADNGGAIQSRGDLLRQDLGQLGFELRSFHQYNARADVIWALQWLPGLRGKLVSQFALFPLDQDRDAKLLDMSLSAYLVASMDPTSSDVAQWVDSDLDPYEQVMVLRYLEQGVSVSELHYAGVRPDADLPSPVELNDALSLRANRPEYTRLSTVLEDIGVDVIDLGVQGVSISQLLLAREMAMRARDVLQSDLETVTSCFKAMNISVPDHGTAIKAFDDRLASEPLPSREKLSRKLDTLLEELRERRDEASELLGLRTRLAIMLANQTLEILQDLRQRSGPLLDWCERVLIGRGDVEWKLGNFEVNADRQANVLRALQTFHDSVLPQWDPDTPLLIKQRHAVPLWRGARKSRFEQYQSRIERACDQARLWAKSFVQDEALETRALEVSSRIVSSIEHVSALSGWLASKQLWLEASDRLAQMLETPDQVNQDLYYVRSRLSAPPDEWDRLVALIDSYQSRSVPESN